MTQPAFDLRPEAPKRVQSTNTIMRASAGSADPSSPRTAPAVRFDSGVRLEDADHIRLGAQIQRVYAVMAGGLWWSVSDLQREIRDNFGVTDPEPSISAQIRNLRKPKHGGHVIQRLREQNGLYKFRLVGE